MWKVGEVTKKKKPLSKDRGYKTLYQVRNAVKRDFDQKGHTPQHFPYRTAMWSQ